MRLACFGLWVRGGRTSLHELRVGREHVLVRGLLDLVVAVGHGLDLGRGVVVVDLDSPVVQGERAGVVDPAKRGEHKRVSWEQGPAFLSRVAHVLERDGAGDALDVLDVQQGLDARLHAEAAAGRLVAAHVGRHLHGLVEAARVGEGLHVGVVVVPAGGAGGGARKDVSWERGPACGRRTPRTGSGTRRRPSCCRRSRRRQRRG